MSETTFYSLIPGQVVSELPVEFEVSGQVTATRFDLVTTLFPTNRGTRHHSSGPPRVRRSKRAITEDDDSADGLPGWPR